MRTKKSVFLDVRGLVALGIAWGLCSANASAITIEEPPHFAADVLFAVSSVELPTDTRKRLDLPLRLGHDLRNACAVVVGHADRLEVGVLDVQQLSSQRAQAVAAIFQADGFSRERMYVEWKGAAQPVAASPNSQNSRVEVDVYPC